ncbi:uncharacterized protein PRCAT00000513001 [Priceomyces carsonii]|uniref:uncharacterized protein n=1 Tax=Priceomyces carsonii TaxID=28549 RepID=UPI002ED8C570|nr:unnamed protein product [Priceomyces carsonii]
MPKRSRERSDEVESELGKDKRKRNNNEDNQSVLIAQIIRTILGRELKGQLIRRDHISPIISKSKASYNTIMSEVTSILEDVYGMTLSEAPVNNKESSKHRENLKSKQLFLLTNCMNTKSKDILGQLWSKNFTETPNTDINAINVDQNEFFLPKHSRTSNPSSNHELVKQGILLLVISLLVLNENRLLEHDLVKILKSFGLADNLNIKNTNYNLNIYELVADFVKKDYLSKQQLKGSTESSTVVEFALGRRALVEFPPESLFSYFKIIYGETFDRHTAERVLITIERALEILPKDLEAMDPTLQEEPTMTSVVQQIPSPSLVIQSLEDDFTHDDEFAD